MDSRVGVWRVCGGGAGEGIVRKEKETQGWLKGGRVRGYIAIMMWLGGRADPNKAESSLGVVPSPIDQGPTGPTEEPPPVLLPAWLRSPRH